MAHQFQKHYTRDEARALLPQIRKWLAELNRLRPQLEKYERRIEAMQTTGQDVGGDLANNWVRTMAGANEALLEFRRREISVKDIERGLVDFPAIIGGREVFLCWEQDEDDIEYWHDLDTGFAGRERL